MRSANQEQKRKHRQPLLYRLIYRSVRTVFPKFSVSGTENLTKLPCVIVGNHSQMYGPLAAEFYMPRDHYIWCVGEMMDRKEVPAYAFQDFWSLKPKRIQWFYRILSHLIAPLAELIFTNAHTIPVYHDARIMTTFRKSVSRLDEGADVVIFPESSEPNNAILTRFHEHFTDLARIYHKRAGVVISFVPMYIAPALKTIYFGSPVKYNPEAPEEEERKRICEEITDAICALAKALPPHTVVPYLNIPKTEYPTNKD